MVYEKTRNALWFNIISCLDLLNDNYKVTCVKYYPVYDKRIMNVWIALEETGYQDTNYLDKISNIKEKPIELLILGEVYTFLTFIYRRERFCDGHITHYIGNNTLHKLLARYIELEL